MKFVDLFLHKADETTVLGKTHSSKSKNPFMINTYAISQHLSRNSHKYISELEKKIKQLETKFGIVENSEVPWTMTPEEYSEIYSTLPPHHGKVLLEVENIPESAEIHIYLK